MTTENATANTANTANTTEPKGAQTSFEQTFGSFVDSFSTKSKRADLRAQAIDRLKATFNGLLSASDVWAARKFALALADHWYAMARGAWLTNRKSPVYAVYLGRSDLWLSIHDDLVGAGFFSRNKLRTETRGALAADGAQKAAKESALDAKLAADLASRQRAGAEKAADEAGLRASDAGKAAFESKAAAAEASVHAKAAEAAAKRAVEEALDAHLATISDTIKAAVASAVAEATASPAKKTKAA